MTDLIQTRHEGAVFEIILNRPEKRNAINLEMMLGLGQAMAEAERAQGARAVLLRGEGQTFSAGVDIVSFQQAAAHFGENWRDNLFPMTHKYQAVLNAVERCSLPVIALLHGHCLGLGMELALACDIRIAAEGTQMGLPETRIGLIPDVGGTTRLTRLVGPARAKELILTGKTIDAKLAERWGIVNSVVASEQLEAQGRAFVAEIEAAAPLAVNYAKRIINAVSDLERGLQHEAWAQSILIRTQDFEQGAQSLLMKQPPQWQGK
jgi:enoyl-CoA hydratase/carnithine racemase